MTVPELHPDELLWREGLDQLTPAERANLTAHLERCPGCAFERAIRADAAQVRIVADLDHALAARAVERVLGARAAGVSSDVADPWKHQLARAAIVVLMLTSTAVGAAMVVRLQRRATPAVQGEPPRPAAREARALRRGESARVPPRTEPEAEPVAGPALHPAVAAPAAHARTTPAVPRANIVAALAPPPLDVATAGAPAEDAAVVFGRAEEARGQRRSADAHRLYQELERRFPGSRQEIVGRVLHGQLLLDELSDAAAALRCFDHYLATEPTGTLAEEARLGRAQALQVLGRASDARAAWQELLRKHPTSVHAPAARARLTTRPTP